MTTNTGGSGEGKTGSALYRLVLSLWVGGIFMYTFLVTPVIFRYFGRDAASAIVDRLFPFYFPFTLAVTVLAFAAFLASRPKRARQKVSLILLVAGMLISLSVNFGIYPEVKRAKREIVSFESESPDSPARTKFRTLHGISMALNLILFADGIALIAVDSFQATRKK